MIKYTTDFLETNKLNGEAFPERSGGESQRRFGSS